MPAIRSLLRSRPSRRATIALAIAGLVTLSAVPVVVLAATPAPSRLEPVKAAYDATLNTPAPTTASTPPSTDNNTGSDGSTLAAKVKGDDKLRRTLLALREQALGLQTVGGTGLARSASAVVVGGTVADIPAIAVSAYRRAALRESVVDPSCHVTWSLLAGIGRVESNHGRFGGSQPDASGVVHPAILGPILDGSGGNSAIPDTDGGRYDGNTQWDRAVGPMQFIPSSWATGGRDGNGDGIADPENLFDAALAAANYLCNRGGDLRTTGAAQQAVLTYNHSWDYVLLVLGYAASYAHQDVSTVVAEVATHLAKPVAKVGGKPVKRRPVPRTTPTRRAPVTPVSPVTPSRAAPTPVRTVTATPTLTPVPVSSPTPSPSPSPVSTPTPTVTQSPTVSTTDPTIVAGFADTSAVPTPAQ